MANMSNASDLAILGEANLHPALETGPRPSDEMFFFPANAHHHRGISFFDNSAGIIAKNVTGRFAAEAATGVFRLMSTI